VKARRTCLRAGTKARGVYDLAHVAWRCGAIASWYYGRRSPSDLTVVWTVDGIEYDRADLSGVTAALDAALAKAGIASASFGDAWCGYRSLHIEYVDGSSLVERNDAHVRAVVRERLSASAAA
jgi:hypothetical protein